VHRNSVCNDRAEVVRLQQAILFYSSGAAIRREYFGSGDSTGYATVHPVSTTENGAVIEAGRPLDKRSLKIMLQCLFKEKEVRTGVLSGRILSIGSESITWWQPPGERTYFFDCRDAVVGQRAGKGLAPGLVFTASQKNLMVFAVKGKNRPEENTPLFHAPLMNVHANGQVCTGSMTKVTSTLSNSIIEWEEAFWRSSFTHPNQQKAVRYKGGLHQLSVDLLDGKFRRFPERVLISHPIATVGDLVNLKAAR